MSIDRCIKCEAFVDTDFDCDCYENPKQECICASCREDMGMEDTETAHTVRKVRNVCKKK